MDLYWKCESLTYTADEFADFLWDNLLGNGTREGEALERRFREYIDGRFDASEMMDYMARCSATAPRGGKFALFRGWVTNCTYDTDGCSHRDLESCSLWKRVPPTVIRARASVPLTLELEFEPWEHVSKDTIRERMLKVIDEYDPKALAEMFDYNNLKLEDHEYMDDEVADMLNDM